MKNLPKILTIIFLCIFILQMIGLIVLLSLPGSAHAIEFEPQVGIPGFDNTITVGPDTIGSYIIAIYRYSIGVVGIIAAVVMMWGGIRWLTAGGNTEKVTDAKAWIGAALTGLILVIASYLILNSISPDLVQFRSLRLN